MVARRSWMIGWPSVNKLSQLHLIQLFHSRQHRVHQSNRTRLLLLLRHLSMKLCNPEQQRLSLQTIRFTTVEQADNAVSVVGDGAAITRGWHPFFEN